MKQSLPITVKVRNTIRSFSHGPSGVIWLIIKEKIIIWDIILSTHVQLQLVGLIISIFTNFGINCSFHIFTRCTSVWLFGLRQLFECVPPPPPHLLNISNYHYAPALMSTVICLVDIENMWMHLSNFQLPPKQFSIAIRKNTQWIKI